MAGYYSQPYSSPYVEAPAPPLPSEYSSNPYDNNVQYADPGSPIVYPVSPLASPMHSRDPSRDRRNTLDHPVLHIVDDGRDRERTYHSSHLVVGASSKALSRSNSDRQGNRKALAYVEVAKSGRGRPGRAPSVGAGYYYEGGKRYPVAGSDYSNSSYQSRNHSRSHSRARHSRSPSCNSCDSLDDHHHDQYAVAPYRKGENDLSEQLRKVQLQLEAVHAESDKRKKEEEHAKLEKLRNEEIERKVAEQLQLQRKKEADAAAEAKRKADAERARIQAEAQKLLQEREAAEKAKKAAEEAEKQKIQAIIDQERQKYEAMNRGRRTYTKFSKVHLCKEALDERNIAYTEEVRFNLSIHLASLCYTNTMGHY